MKSMLRIIISVFLIIIAGNSQLFAQAGNEETSKSAKERILPFGTAWAKEKGIELPLPFGVSVYSIFMSRDIDVTSVSIEFMDREPQNIDDFASFGVRNRTMVTALKFDAWVLPVLNVYFLGGFASTDANVSASFTVENDITQRPPTEFDIESTACVKWPYAGIGSSLVAGYGS